MIANTRLPLRFFPMINPPSKNQLRSISRRAVLKNIALAPLLLKAAPLLGMPIGGQASRQTAEFLDIRFAPHYPSTSPLADILARVAPGERVARR